MTKIDAWVSLLDPAGNVIAGPVHVPGCFLIEVGRNDRELLVPITDIEFAHPTEDLLVHEVCIRVVGVGLFFCGHPFKAKKGKSLTLQYPRGTPIVEWDQRYVDGVVLEHKITKGA